MTNLVVGTAGSDIPIRDAVDVDNGAVSSGAVLVRAYSDKDNGSHGFEIRGYKLPSFRVKWAVAAGYVKNYAIFKDDDDVDNIYICDSDGSDFEEY